MLPSQSTMRTSLASFGFFIFFCSSIIYFSPPSFGQIDKQYIQQQNSRNQFEQRCRSLEQNAKQWFYRANGGNSFIVNIGGQTTFVRRGCGWSRVLGKTYKDKDGGLDMFKLEGNKIIVYTKSPSSTEIFRYEDSYAVSQPEQPIVIPEPFTGFLE